MRTLSAAYLAAAKGAGRYPDIYAIIYGDNDTLTISGKNAIISANITRGDTAKPAYFEVGRAISSSAVLSVDRRRINDESLIVSGAKIEIYAEFDNSAGTAIASAILATMYISGYDNQDKDLGYIYAVDRLVYTGGDFNPDGLTYPVDLEDMLTEAFDQSGLSGVSVTLPVNPHVNSAPYQAEEPVADGMSGDPYTCRDVIGKIAGMQMSDLFMDADGQPKVYAYGAYITGAITDDMIYDLSVSAESFAVNQVIVYKSDKRMPKDDAHYQKLPYNPRFEDMDDISSGGAWWDEIVARAHVFVRTGWTTCRVTFAGVGELEPGDFVEIGSAAIPAFVSGVEYEFSNAAFRETVYSFAYTLEEYYQAPSKATVVSTDVKKTGGGGVGEDLGNGNERFNDYTDNDVTGGSYHHVEGTQNTIAAGQAGHVGGYHNTVGNILYSAVYGRSNTINYAYCVDIVADSSTITYANGGAIFGSNHTINNETNCIIGGTYVTVNGAQACLAVGNYLTVTGYYNIIGGYGNTTTPAANYSLGVGNGNAIKGNSNIVGGDGNDVGGARNIVGGQDNKTTYNDSLTVGSYNENDAPNSIMCGKFGTAGVADRIVVGDGQSGTLSNVFRVDFQGNVYATAYNTSGADYAEFFEWADGNPYSEDRRGLLVQLTAPKWDDKSLCYVSAGTIEPANGDDILGVVSCRPSVIGNAYEDEWRGKYKRDIYGDYIRDENGKRQLSDDYDKNREYIPRSQRSEWAAVGMVGRLIIRDNGKCQPGGYVSARQGIGVPTFTETRAQCIRRLDGSHIEIIVR